MKVRPKILPDEPRGIAWRSSARGVNCPVKSGKSVSIAMTKKLRLTPGICYMLGLYSHGRRRDCLYIRTYRKALLDKFVEILLKELDIKSEKIKVEKGEEMEALTYNSKAVKLMQKTLERKDRVFKYFNDYSGNYFAALYDVDGGSDANGMYIRKMKEDESRLLESYGIRIVYKNGKHYIHGKALFVTLIGKYSLTL